jgi:hypothetical protein
MKVLEHPSNRCGSAVISEDCTDASVVDDDYLEDDGRYFGIDEEGGGAAGDYSHKYSNKIFVHTQGRSSVMPFTASLFTLMNRKEAIVRNIFTIDRRIPIEPT